MYPDRIPEIIRTDPARAAECGVYEALLETLGDEYTVYGWVAWVGRRTGQGGHDGEADFVIAHPEHGLAVLEVKGGVVRVDGVTGRWSSVSTAGNEYVLKESPFAQARRHRYDLERKLAEHPAWPGAGVTFGYAVAFPDCAAPVGDMGPEAPRELLVWHDDLGRIDERVAGIGRYWRRRDEVSPMLGTAGVELVSAQLARSYQLRMPLGRSIAEDSRRLIELSEGQFRVLDGLSRNRRVLVTGGAGTGKTLLALEKAKRLARDDGFRTLLTCFNRPLAEYLQASVGGIAGLSVLNFHELCAEFARRNGRTVPDPSLGNLSNAFFREELPLLLVDALAALPDRFEAIVVDEGQDFSATDRAALELALVDRTESVLYVFQDETQAIYRDGTPWPDSGMASYVLTENLRNTQAIHTVLGRLAGDTRTRAAGPPGVPPEFVVAVGAREQSRELSRVLHRLVREECVPQGAIAVLVSSRRAVPELVQAGRIGAFEVTTEHDAADGRVLVESVTRFKGLERDVVVLVGLEPVDYCEYEPMLYVGASRARSQLVVIGDDALVARFAGAADGAAGSARPEVVR